MLLGGVGFPCTAGVLCVWDVVYALTAALEAAPSSPHTCISLSFFPVQLVLASPCFCSKWYECVFADTVLSLIAALKYRLLWMFFFFFLAVLQSACLTCTLLWSPNSDRVDVCALCCVFTAKVGFSRVIIFGIGVLTDLAVKWGFCVFSLILRLGISLYAPQSVNRLAA